MALFVGLDISQKTTAICVVDDTGRRVWRGQCASDPERIEQVVRRYAGDDARIGLETGPMTPWLVHELRGRGLDVTCLDAGHALDAEHARAALKMQINKTDQNDAEGLAQRRDRRECPDRYWLSRAPLPSVILKVATSSFFFMSTEI